jgi:peptidoglycan hydrolase-like protein with peptidoglycan-binding domain
MTYGPLTLDESKWGRERLLINGKDVTFLRGIYTVIESWSHASPFGFWRASFFFPQVTGHELLRTALGVTVLKGANVDLQLILPDGSLSPDPLWEGFITETEPVKTEQSYGVRVSCLGYLYQSDLQTQKPRASFSNNDPVAISARVKHTLNRVIGRRYKAVTVTDGPSSATTRKRGSLSQSALNFSAELLATSWGSTGRRWTALDKKPGRRAHVVRVDTTTEHYTKSFGAIGFSVDPLDDLTERPNVIYGSGITPDGGAWSNYFLPNYHPDDTADFPLAPGSDFVAGTATAGFQDFSDAMRARGYKQFDSQDTYVTGDVDDVEDFQKRAGITIDGVVGRQTWDALFQPGSNVGSLGGGIFLPLAWDPRVEPYLYNGRGHVIGDNPEYDPTVLRVEKWVNYGDGVWKRDARKSAKRELAALGDEGWTGTAQFRTNPQECHRFAMKAGRNLRIRHFGGAHTGVLVHLADVTVQRQQGSVDVTFDTAARDYMTLADIKARNKETRSDPARGILRRARRATSALDTHVVFDAESPAGIVPPHQVQGGFWTVIPILFGEWGNVVETVYHSNPDTEYWLGVFSKRVTPNQLLAWVGDPSTASADKPWDVSYDVLRQNGLLMAYGTKQSPCGYWPHDKTDDPTPDITGDWTDDMSFEWASQDAPRLWIAEFAVDDTYLRGHFKNAPIQD